MTMTPDEENRLAHILLSTLQKASQDTTASHVQNVAALALEIVQAVGRLHASFHPNAHAEAWRSVNPAYPNISGLPWRAAQAVYLFICTVTPEKPIYQMNMQFNLQAFEQTLNMIKNFMLHLVREGTPASTLVDQQALKLVQRLNDHTGAYALQRVTVQDAVIQLAGLSSDRNDRPDTVRVYSRDASSITLTKNDRRVRVTFVQEESR